MTNILEAAGYLRLGARITRAVAQIAVDRCEEVLGQALPRTAEQLARTAVVAELIRRAPPSGSAPLPPVRAVDLPGVEFESSNCTNFLIRVEFEAEPGASAPPPKTLYAKLPCSEVATRAFANAVGFWEVEAAFCEGIAPKVPIRVPRVFGVARRGVRFVLLLENLQELPGARLFLNRDMAAGTTPEPPCRPPGSFPCDPPAVDISA